MIGNWIRNYEYNQYFEFHITFLMIDLIFLKLDKLLDNHLV